MSRWKAAGIHLLLSLVIALAAITIVLLIFFPKPYAESAGASRLLTILIAVDVTLGPLITAIIYKQGKPGLKMDLAIIGTLQAAALCYGLYAIGQARPVYLVYMKDRFSLVPAALISDAEQAKAQAPYNKKPLVGPVKVGTFIPQHSREIAVDAALAGFDIDVLPMFYIDYQFQIPDIVANGKPLSELLEFNDQTRLAVTEWGKNRELGDYFYYPLITNNGYQTLILDSDSVEPVDVLPVDPW